MPDVSSASVFLSTLNEIHPSLSFTMELENNGKRLSWNDDYQIQSQKRHGGLCETNWYWTLLHYQSHVDEKYKHSLMKKMWNRAFKLSSSGMSFHQECQLLKKGFSRLHYPETLVENTIRHFIELKVTEDVRAKQQVSNEHDALIRIVLPVKAQKSANVVRHQLGDPSRKIDVDVQLFTQVRRSKDNSSRKNNKLQLLINKTLFIIISVVCVLQTMSASRADRYIDVWRNTSDQQSAIT